MKLQQLPMDARFEYEGRVFVKNGPLTGKPETGSSVLIPRSAHVTPLDGHAPAAKPAPATTLDRLKVMKAFDDFFLTCSRLVNDPSGQSLEAARQRFLAALK